MNTESPKERAYRLRKLRRGVTLRFNGFNRDGVPEWLLYDEGQNKFFVIGWPEYEMLSRRDLGDPKAIIEAVNKETTLHVDMEDFENLEAFLNKNLLIELRWRSLYQSAKEQKIIKGENIAYWFIRYYLFFRIPLFRPDKFLNRTKYIGNFIFNRYVTYFMLFLGLIAIYQINEEWQAFSHTFSTLFSWQYLFYYFIAFTIAKIFHELGHAYMCKQYGVPVPTMGVAFLVFWPVLYTDTTESWSLPSHQRMRIALAGMWIETYVTIIAVLLWANIHNVTIQTICYVMVAINWVATLLINVSPFMRFDGYYILSDLLKVPNLQSRSFALARWQIRNWLFGWEELLPEHFSKRMHWILVCYAFATWIYRLFIYFAIALLVYHFFFKVLGIILFIIEMFVFFLNPIAREIRAWYDQRNRFTWNYRTIITVLVSIVGIFFLFVPFRETIKLPATLSYAHEFLYAKQDGTIQSQLPARGTSVKAQQVIVELKSPELEYNLTKAKLEYAQILAQVRRASLNTNYFDQLSSLKAELSQKNEEYNKLLKLQEELIIKAPFDGIITDFASMFGPGSVVMKNSWILDVTNPKSLIVEAYAAQPDFEVLKIGARGTFYPNNLSEVAIPVILSAIEPINTPELTWRYSQQTKENIKQPIQAATPSYQVSELGGQIPANLTEKNEYVPIDSMYRVLLIPENPTKLQQIELGAVLLTIEEPRSLVDQVFYKIKRIFIQESGF